ncbi:MAG: hypothetical protein MJE77_13310 [Proteobacteria bacterium]|nr:hypothetical protein [Pseudomonadota bacterium]
MARDSLRCMAIWAVALVEAPATAAAGSYCEPGPAATQAQALLDQDKSDADCDAFLAAVKAGTPDPWAYRGTAGCATDKIQGPRIRAAFEAALGSMHDPSLAAFGRSMLPGPHGKLGAGLIAGQYAVFPGRQPRGAESLLVRSRPLCGRRLGYAEGAWCLASHCCKNWIVFARRPDGYGKTRVDCFVTKLAMWCCQPGQ